MAGRFLRDVLQIPPGEDAAAAKAGGSGVGGSGGGGCGGGSCTPQMYA